MDIQLISKVQESINVMKKAYDVYRTTARQNLEKNQIEDYWHWTGIAEGTRRSWELLEEMLDIGGNDDV